MQHANSGSQLRPLISQDQHNTTLWIGHLRSDPMDHFAGQTFTCPSAGMLDNIQVYSSEVHYPGKVELSLHEFDQAGRSWGPALANSTLDVERNDHEKWIRFKLPSVELRPGTTYGFRLNTPDAMIGLGEAATGMQNPFKGQEWNADSSNKSGHYFSYFSLSFRVELLAASY